MNFENESITFASLYCRRNSDPVPTSFDRFINQHYLRLPSLVLGADTNAHCATIGYSPRDERGSRWDDLIAEKAWIIHNAVDKPTFRNSRGHESTIDLTITSGNIYEIVHDWTTESYTALSDHLPIQFTVQKPINVERKLVRNFKRTNWTDVNEALLAELSHLHEEPLTTTGHINDLVESLKDKITGVMDKFIPLVPLTQKRNKWWNDKPQKMKKRNKTQKKEKRKRDRANTMLKSLKPKSKHGKSS